MRHKSREKKVRKPSNLRGVTALIMTGLGFTTRLTHFDSKSHCQETKNWSSAV